MGRVYASGNFDITWVGVPLHIGTGETFLTITPNGDLYDVQFDATGEQMLSVLANQGATIEMTFKQTSEALDSIDIISAAAATVGLFSGAPEEGPFTLEDPEGVCNNFVAWKAVLINKGTTTHQLAMGERTLKWSCEKLIYGNPASIMENIAQYIK